MQNFLSIKDDLTTSGRLLKQDTGLTRITTLHVCTILEEKNLGPINMINNTVKSIPMYGDSSQGFLGTDHSDMVYHFSLRVLCDHVACPSSLSS